MKIQKQPDYLIFADSAKKGENAEFPDISRGWGITIEQTASKPPMEWMNGAFNRVDKNMLYLLQQGVPEWSDKVTYPVNAIIKYNGVLYTAITENDNTKPSANTTKWKKTQAEIPIASTTQKGIVKLNSAIDSDSQTEAATPLAVKKVNDSAVKKSGDTMDGNLTIANGDSSAVLLRNTKNEEYMLRIHADGSFSIFNRNSNGKWVSKFRNDSNANVWRFENTNDVTISGKSVLKTGDYGIGAQTGTTAQNLDEHLNAGFYGTNTSKIPNLPFAGGGSAASLLVLPSESPHWKVEQLSVVDGLTPRIYYRTDTKNNGKQNWYEVITTANKELSNVIDKFASGGIESRVYSHDKRFYFVVRNDGLVGFYDTVRDKLLWSFRDDYFEIGKIPLNRIDGLNNYILSMYNQSFNANGFSKLPNGMVIQWGLANFQAKDGANGTMQSFYTEFPNACCVMLCSDGGIGVHITSAGPVNKRQFRCWSKESTPRNGVMYTDTAMFYIAIGF